MKKFKLKKSANEEVLQPIVKITQTINNEDKEYSNQSKYGLINYLKSEFKQGKIKLYAFGDIEEEDSLKHIIVSPCKISRWEKMDENERLELRGSFIEKLKKDFKNYSYLLAIEEKTRKNESGDDILMEHYHLVISSKVPTNKEFKINYKKSLMNNYIENHTTKQTRVKLGLKTFSEIKENRIIKLKKYHREKYNSIVIKEELSTLYQLSKYIFNDKKDCLNLTRLQKHYILKQKSNIFKEVSSISDSIKSTITFTYNLNNVIKELSSVKNNLSKQFTNELIYFKNITSQELKDYSHFIKNEHSFFTKLQQYKLKNKFITQEEFLTSVCRKRAYWSNEEIFRRREIEKRIEIKQYEFMKQVRAIQSKIFTLTNEISAQNEYKNILNNRIEVKKYLTKNKNLELQTNDEIFSKKLQIYNNYFSFIQEKIKNKKEEKIELSKTNIDINLK